jgi:SAM-dependent methyltransferase
MPALRPLRRPREPCLSAHARLLVQAATPRTRRTEQIREEKRNAMTSTAQTDARPLPEVMLQLITGYWVSQSLGVVARLGVPDQLATGPRSSAELAQAVGAQPRALFRVLRLLASIGVFAEPTADSFELTPLGETLRTDAPGSVRDFAIAETAFGHWQPWGRLLESVKSGEPQPRQALGIELWEWYGQNPEEAAFFSRAMGNLSALAAHELLRVCDFSQARTVVDVGGAYGELLATVLEAQPRLRGVLYDLPHVIEGATASIDARGLRGRCDLVGGDFFAQVPSGGDVHILKQVLHDWDDERATLLLHQCHRALTPGGRLLVVEMVLPEDNQPSAVQSMDINMLVMLGGRERTVDEYTALFDTTGFRLERVIPTHSPFAVLEATRS